MTTNMENQEIKIEEGTGRGKMVDLSDMVYYHKKRKEENTDDATQEE